MPEYRYWNTSAGIQIQEYFFISEILTLRKHVYASAVTTNES